jgi:hypothetical protein
MGRQIVRVPPDFLYPTDEQGEPIYGAHHEVLHGIPDEQKTAYQIYENVSDWGSPVSPVFASLAELTAWLSAAGASNGYIQTLIRDGHAPSFVTTARQ